MNEYLKWFNWVRHNLNLNLNLSLEKMDQSAQLQSTIYNLHNLNICSTLKKCVYFQAWL